jgi:hypothetical protein
MIGLIGAALTAVLGYLRENARSTATAPAPRPKLVFFVWLASGVAFTALTIAVLNAVAPSRGIYSNSNDEKIPVGQSTALEVDCNPGDLVTGGGYECRSATGCENLIVERTLPTNDRRWEVRALNRGGGTEALDVRVSARCLQTGARAW